MSKKLNDIKFEQACFALMGEMMINISHQWKQPLNTISLAVIATKISDDSKKSALRNFDIIEQSVQNLSNTMDKFFSFFNIERNFQKKEIDFIIEDIKNIINTHLQNRGILLTTKNNAQNVEISTSISLGLLSVLNIAKKYFQNTQSEGSKEILLEFKSTDKNLEIICSFNAPFTKNEKELYLCKYIVKNIFNTKIEIYSNEKSSLMLLIPYGDKCLLKHTEK